MTRPTRIAAEQHHPADTVRARSDWPAVRHVLQGLQRFHEQDGQWASTKQVRELSPGGHSTQLVTAKLTVAFHARLVERTPHQGPGYPGWTYRLTGLGRLQLLNPDDSDGGEAT